MPALISWLPTFRRYRSPGHSPPHPLYTGVMLVAVGWALAWQSWPALLAAATLVPFFRAKAGREERWLREKFPEYGDYERRVRRFLPWP